MLAFVGAGCARGTVEPPTVASSSTQETIAPLAILQLDVGAATVTRGDETDSAPDGLELMPGDTVRVTSGTVALVYPEAGMSRLESGTVLTLLPDGQGEGSVFTQIELSAGSIWTRLERLLGKDEKFSVSSNGVVATVRGTAFGVSAVDGEAEVDVAESGVDVNMIEARRDLRLASQGMRVGAGEKVRVAASTLGKLDAKAKKLLVRKISDQEKKAEGFVFAMKKIDEKMLRGPASRVRMKHAMEIPDALKDRLDPKMLEQILRMNTTPEFISPEYLKDRVDLFEQLVSSTQP